MLTPGRYYPNSPIRLTIAFTDADGAGVDPSTVLIKTYSPTGTTTTYTYGTDSEVQKSSVGNYYADITPDAGGVWYYRWQTTGTGTTYADEGTINVIRSPFIDGQDAPAYAALR